MASYLTTDGGAHWTDVTPPQLVPLAKVSIIEASHFDAQTAYAAINTLRLDDLRPHIFRTHDGGKTWTEIVNGIPANENVNAVREDPKRKGLLFAGTERAVYVSFDDGDHWQSLRLNMAASSVRDVIIKDDDRIGDLDVNTIIPGHGEVLSGKAYVAQVVEMVSAVNAEVEKELNAGLTKDEVLERAPKNLDVQRWRRLFWRATTRRTATLSTKASRGW